MNDRKQNVISLAHDLFIEKGFQSTSIQDILDYTGISKGTFYNYFSSKNELLIAIFKTTYKKMEIKRDELLIGKDPSTIDSFILQLEMQMMINRKNKLVTLFEEVIVSDDPELKQFIREGQIKQIQWLYSRFIDLFGEEKQPYLLDVSIMFLGILHQNVKYYSTINESSAGISKAVKYTVSRIVGIAEEVSASEEQLFSPTLIDNWLQNHGKTDQTFKDDLNQTITKLITSLKDSNDTEDLRKLIEFVQDEILHTKKPRRFLIESAVFTLKSKGQLNIEELDILETHVKTYFSALGE
ncbi:TetR/AcrR family transcriptional regulator [Cytobacillus purgationiresistens]|uniref:AcrR family transcriptional regulator n=1 Tax=Cytobacillus purgationiresistens TaxID=863449 RepID=A0ABU0AQW1_9BACI|nr:TetR/AcrR family transcriptional regulator [Cytobacillus purgationiresistens]MDQ0273259.1 AcrR family transcriptional regulator [Cytobacillus purgationiresistens]